MSRYHRCWVGKRMPTSEWYRTFQFPADSDEFFPGGIAVNEQRTARCRNWEILRAITVLKTKYTHKSFYLRIDYLNWIKELKKLKSFKHGDYLLLTVQYRVSMFWYRFYLSFFFFLGKILFILLLFMFIFLYNNNHGGASNWTRQYNFNSFVFQIQTNGKPSARIFLLEILL